MEDNTFKMHRFVQFPRKKLLELCDKLRELEGDIYMRILDNAFPKSKYENWPVCLILFLHAEIAVAY